MFRCESIVLQTYWVLVVMDQYTLRILGFGTNEESSMAWRCAICSNK
jgi:hypothetical protein